MSRTLQRYNDRDRMNHWFIAMMFVLAGLSGLAFFHPSLFFFSHLFGGGSWATRLGPATGSNTSSRRFANSHGQTWWPCGGHDCFRASLRGQPTA